MTEPENSTGCVAPPPTFRIWGIVVMASVCSCVAMAVGFWFGTAQKNDDLVLPPILAATAGHSETMAVATGLISNDAEGIFFLDFITGQLQCIVYYPRQQTFGAHYFTNVNANLPAGGKNKKYLLSTGLTIPQQLGAGAIPGRSLVYVTDVNTGFFAAYAVPWDRSAEPSGRYQAGPLIFAGGGQIRNFQLPDPQPAPPAAIVDPNQQKQP